MEAEFERQLAKIKKIDIEAQAEERELELVNQERTRTISTLVGEAWMTKTFPDKYASVTDPLLAKKFKTRAGYSSIRLEKLLLELDQVDTLGDENLKAQRKQEVRYIQNLLQKADDLNSKALRLVQFQESLANVGKQTLRTTLEQTPSDGSTGGANGGAAPDGGLPPQGGARRFAEEVPSNQVDSTEDDKVIPGPKHKDATDDTVEELAPSDSHDDLQATQEVQDCMTREYYLNQHRQNQGDKEDGKQAKRVEVQADVEMDEEQHNQSRRKSGGSSRSRHSLDETRVKPEPLVQIKEMPRAYVMLVKDAFAARAAVSLDADHKLHIAVPGKQRMEYSLGSNINTRGITKEVHGDVLQIVLPKNIQKPQQVRSTGNPYLGGIPILRGGGWNRDDFWSRF